MEKALFVTERVSGTSATPEDNFNGTLELMMNSTLTVPRSPDNAEKGDEKWLRTEFTTVATFMLKVSLPMMLTACVN